jgi:uncharacterized membrane protein YpjA
MIKNILKNKYFLILIASINIIVAIYSLNYYLTQLISSPKILWIFIPDSIIATLIFGIAILLFALKKLPKSLSALALVGMWKYGLWTLFILIMDLRPFAPNWYFYTGHFLMILETLILWKKFKFKPIHFAPAFGFFLVNDLLDYLFSLHPPFNTNYFLETAVFAFILTIILPILVFKAYSKEK